MYKYLADYLKLKLLLTNTLILFHIDLHALKEYLCDKRMFRNQKWLHGTSPIRRLEASNYDILTLLAS